MDGWESRRKRTPGHDWALYRLGVEGRILAFDVDTAFFTGNYPPRISIEGASGVVEHPDLASCRIDVGVAASETELAAAKATIASAEWFTLLESSALLPGHSLT
jgi:allantoicase